jgi:hypothetical protein
MRAQARDQLFGDLEKMRAAIACNGNVYRDTVKSVVVEYCQVKLSKKGF